MQMTVELEQAPYAGIAKENDKVAVQPLNARCGISDDQEQWHTRRDRMYSLHTVSRDKGSCQGDEERGNARELMQSLSPVAAEADADNTAATFAYRKICAKIFLTLIVFLGVTFVLERWADEEVSVLSEKFMSFLGLPGLFILVFILDGVPQPFTYVPLIFIAVKGSIPKENIFVVCATASYSAALAGYCVGRHIRRLRCGSYLFDSLSNKYPFVPDIMQKKGAWGVVVAGAMPVPFALATWTAGSFGVPFAQFALAGTMRFPKIALFVCLSRCTQCDERGSHE